MVDSSDCTYVVKQTNPTFQETVLDSAIDTKAVKLVKVDTITPRACRGSRLSVVDIIVLDDDRVVLVVDGRGKLLQYYTREYGYIDEVDMPNDVAVGCVVKSDKNLLGWIDTPLQNLIHMNINSSIKIEFCTVMEMGLKLLWKEIDLPISGLKENVKYEFSNCLACSDEVYAMQFRSRHTLGKHNFIKAIEEEATFK